MPFVHHVRLWGWGSVIAPLLTGACLLITLLYHFFGRQALAHAMLFASIVVIISFANRRRFAAFHKTFNELIKGVYAHPAITEARRKPRRGDVVCILENFNTMPIMALLGFYEALKENFDSAIHWFITAQHPAGVAFVITRLIDIGELKLVEMKKMGKTISQRDVYAALYPAEKVCKEILNYSDPNVLRIASLYRVYGVDYAAKCIECAFDANSDKGLSLADEFVVSPRSLKAPALSECERKRIVVDASARCAVLCPH